MSALFQSKVPHKGVDSHFMTACQQHEETCRAFDWYVFSFPLEYNNRPSSLPLMHMSETTLGILHASESLCLVGLWSILQVRHYDRRQDDELHLLQLVH
eukprot:COSAG06_NODE_9754_length_1826_cov_1.065394_2_plen_99_part_00